jgi:hypothetical protein
MPLQKVKSARVITVSADSFVGDKGLLFFDEDVPTLRLGDGITPGGIVISTGGGSTSSYVLPIASPTVLGGIKIGSNLTISPDGVLSVSSGTAAAFKTIVVNTSTSLIAQGEDTVEFIAGAGISITGNPSGSPYKTITFSSSAFGNIDGGGPDSVYGGVALIDGGGI